MATGTVTSIGSSNSAASSTASSLAITGLASGLDWSTVVTALANAERAPEIQWKNQQTTLANQNSAYSTITSELMALQLDAQKLRDGSFYEKVTASSSDSSVLSASVSSGTPTGNYTFHVSQLAAAAQLNGATFVSQVLDPGGDPSTVTVGTAGFSTPVKGGTFTVDGAQVTIAATDSLKSVFDAIATATNNKVTASYSATTDKITLASSDGKPITLGSAADTSNFLQVAQLYNNNSGSVSSVSSLGHVNTLATMANADLKTPISDGGSGAGQFSINGVVFNYNASTDTIQNLLNNINESAAGVSAAYDSVNNRFVLTNSTTGDVGIAVKDMTGNFLAATGLSSGTLSSGKDLVYTLNNSTQSIYSHSNTIDSTNSGIIGLTVNVSDTGDSTVAVATDTATIGSAIQQFVTDYNTVQSYMASQQSVNTGTDGSVTPGVLTGDATTNELVTRLRSLMSQVGGSGVVKSLTDLGFKSNGNDNTIALNDSTVLTSMLTSHMGDVKALFANGTSGLAASLSTFVTNTTGASGTLTGRQDDLTKQSNSISTQISNLETKISNDTALWNSEFQAMETAQAQANQELTYITQGVSSGSL